MTLAWPCWPATTSEVTCWAARVSANAGSSTIVATFHRVVRLPFLCISLLLLRGTIAWRYPASRPARDRARHDSRERRRALWGRASREGRRSKGRSSTLIAALHCRLALTCRDARPTIPESHIISTSWTATASEERTG